MLCAMQRQCSFRQECRPESALRSFAWIDGSALPSSVAVLHAPVHLTEVQHAFEDVTLDISLTRLVSVSSNPP